MATYEKKGQMTYVDAAGNEYLLFPKTKPECIPGVAEHLANKDNPHGVTIEQIGAAPAGYGLGGNAIDITGKNLNDYTKWGVYYWGGTHTNAPFDWGYMEVIPSNGESVTQVARKIGYVDGTVGIQVQRTMNKWGTWGEWEWDNPTMALGVEYRTTKRHNGKAVWVKSVDIGSLTTKNIEAFIGTGCTEIVDTHLNRMLSGVRVTPWCNNPWCWVEIVVDTDKDYSSITAVLTVEWTKD